MTKIEQLIKDSNLTESELSAIIEEYLDKKNKTELKKSYLGKIRKNLLLYYRSRQELKENTQRIAFYEKISKKLLNKLIDLDYKLVILTSPTGVYVDTNTLKEYFITSEVYKLGSDENLPYDVAENIFSRMTSSITDKDKQIIAIYFPIVGFYFGNFTSYKVININE